MTTFGRQPVAEPGEEQRRDRDLGDRLRRHDQRIDGALGEPRIGDEDRERHADRDGAEEADEHLGQRIAGVDQEARPVLDELLGDPRRRRQDVDRHLEPADGDLPDHEEDDQRPQGRRHRREEADRRAAARHGGVLGDDGHGQTSSRNTPRPSKIWVSSRV